MVSTDSGTMADLEPDRKPLEITFKTTGLTYAEKLLLKQHRRTQLGELPDGGVSPRLSDTLSARSGANPEATPRRDIYSKSEHSTLFNPHHTFT